MNSIHHGDGVLQLGAQWIHGRVDCPLWKFVNDNQIPGMFCQTNEQSIRVCLHSVTNDES